MGRHLTFSLNFPRETSLTDILRPLFQGDFIRPITVGGYALPSHKKHRHGLALQYFLAGYALEHFIALRGGDPYGQPGGLYLDAPDPSPEHAYLLDIANRLRKGQNDYDTRSPYEFDDPSADITFVLHSPLDLDILHRMDTWQSEFIYSSFDIHSSIAIAIQPDDNHPLPRINAYRFYLPSPAQLLQTSIRLDSRAHGQTRPYIHFYFRSPSTIWLANCDDLNGLVTADKADSNLSQLSDVLREIIRSSQAQPEVTMEMEGSLFNKEYLRIRAMFADILTE